MPSKFAHRFILRGGFRERVGKRAIQDAALMEDNQPWCWIPSLNCMLA
jgi:hypothetical protein